MSDTFYYIFPQHGGPQDGHVIDILVQRRRNQQAAERFFRRLIKGHLLDEEANLSLKLSAQDRYDSTPNGLRPNDINYSILLLWKL